MAHANHNQISLYQETKASLKSLIQQTTQVFVGFMIMLLVTGGNPSGLVVGLSFCLGVGFVAWSEKNRLESSIKTPEIVEPETPITSVESFETPKEVPTENSDIDLSQSDIETLIPRNISRTKQIVLKIKFSLLSKSESFQNLQNLIQRVFEADTNDFLELAEIAGLDARTDLAGADLRGFDLSRANLSGANLSGANLSGANLRNTIIDAKTEIDSKWRIVWEIVNQGAAERDLSRANLSRANLSRANLSRAILSRAILWDANLSRANLSRAFLSRANLSRANLSRAILWDAHLSGAFLSDAHLSGADLSRANLSDAYLSRAILSRAILSYAHLSGADLSGADLSRANLSDAYLSRANLSGANLSGANVENARFGYNEGISEDMKRDLIARGAIFEDSPGDRSRVLVGV